MQIRIDRVQALLLKLVSAQLVGQADAPAFLPKVNQGTFSVPSIIFIAVINW